MVLKSGFFFFKGLYLADEKGCSPVFVSDFEHGLTGPWTTHLGTPHQADSWRGQDHTEARREHGAAGHFQARPFLADTEAGGSGAGSSGF